MDETNTLSTEFETRPCPRCHGSGHHSYCQRFGTTCFRCGGAKREYTKRGKAAVEVFRWLLSREARYLKVGDVIRIGAITFGGDPYEEWSTVTDIRPLRDEEYGTSWINGVEQPRPVGLLCITTVNRKGRIGGISGVSPSKLMRLSQQADYKQAAKAAALEYQTHLTKTGTYRKR